MLTEDGKMRETDVDDCEMASPFCPSTKLCFYLVVNLKEIWKELNKCIRLDEIILYPDNEQE